MSLTTVHSDFCTLLLNPEGGCGTVIRSKPYTTVLYINTPYQLLLVACSSWIDRHLLDNFSIFSFNGVKGANVVC